MKHFRIIFIALLFAASAFTFMVQCQWQVKEDSYSIKFNTKGAEGTMKGLKGKICFDTTDLSHSAFDVTVDVNTISTGNDLKNKHALADNFFNAATYPTIRFISESIEKSDANYVVKGKLTIKDVTKDMSIPFTFENSGTEATFRGKFEVSRKDFNLNKGGIGEIVAIELVVPVKK